MRNIVFRAKDKDDGRWYEGSYMRLDDTTYCFREDYEKHPDNTKHYIVFDRMVDWGLPNRHLQADADPETLCQFTGLTDMNGKRIFEGDIIVHHRTLWGEDVSDVGVIKWSEENCRFYRTSKEQPSEEPFISARASASYEVIGNIFDNPELLEELKV